MTNDMAKPAIQCASSVDSDQPGHQHCLIRVITVQSTGNFGYKFSSCGQRIQIRLSVCLGMEPGYFHVDSEGLCLG